VGEKEGVLIFDETEASGLIKFLGADQRGQLIDSLGAFATWGYPNKDQPAIAPFLHSTSVLGEHFRDRT
jgi:hypothetical protein